jgi:simple sugar transport system ATP-binding protein
MPSEPTELAVEFHHVSKIFGEVYANRGVTFSVRRGTIHGIVGENGAGKSTAMNILYGLYPQTDGDISVFGKKRRWRSPSDAISEGIGMVHQHFMLAGPMSVLDNIILGAEPAPRSLRFLPRLMRPINRSKAIRRLSSLGKSYGMSVPWDKPIHSLTVGHQQKVEILKLLYRNSEILILDEPTAVLTPLECNELFENLKQLKGEGKTILMITHKLKEVMAATDDVTVFRAGGVVGSLRTRQTSAEELAELMVGRKLKQTRAERGARDTKAVLEFSHVSGTGLKDISFHVRAGETVGVAGVHGNGQTELLQAIFHPRERGRVETGNIKIFGKSTKHLTASEIHALGVARFPEDRLKEGLLEQANLVENFILGHQRQSPLSRHGILRPKEASKEALCALKRFDVRPLNLQARAGSLSGGNQQKLVVARELWHSPKLIIAAQPTRGVDIGAIEFIHGQLQEVKAAGAGVLLVSTELDEILALSDRVLVMFEGAIVADLPRDTCDEKTLGLSMGCGREKP